MVATWYDKNFENPAAGATMHPKYFLCAVLATIGLITSCNRSGESLQEEVFEESSLTQPPIMACRAHNQLKTAFFGDLHVHTAYSFDAPAYLMNLTPLDANRFARGQIIPFFPLDEDGVAIGRAKIDRPLDFLAVTDHSEFLGEWHLCTTPDSPMYESDFCRDRFRADVRAGLALMGRVISMESPLRYKELCGDDGLMCQQHATIPWHGIQEAANQSNIPCIFTSFIGYEYTGTPGNSNYHRNVIFRNANVPELPVSYIDAPVDSQLWSSLDDVCDREDGCDYLTIPHNSNLSNGRMAPYRRIADTVEAKLDYSTQRLKREPIMEIFQHKGASECINGLSSVLGAPDELCNIEAVREIGATELYLVFDEREGVQSARQVQETTQECDGDKVGSYGMFGAGCVGLTDFQRSGLLVGLKEELRIGKNPIKLGVIASTDSHTGTPGAVLESSWAGAVYGEDNGTGRLQAGWLGLPLTTGIDGNPGGLAGVWAEENTRDSIFDAMLRREVFGTSGPRIRPRLFAGWGLPDDLCDADDMIAKAYEKGVPMGGDLLSVEDVEQQPKFLVYATKDPMGRKLEALQLIKGWIDSAGGMHNEVISVIEDLAGADSLCSVYTDEDFDSSQSAYYYLRVVEPSSPRWHTYDCARLEEDERPSVCSDGSYPETIREMAWTSPIWYRY